MREPATELTSLIGWSVSGRLTAGGLPESETDFAVKGFSQQIRMFMCNRIYLQGSYIRDYTN